MNMQISNVYNVCVLLYILTLLQVTFSKPCGKANDDCALEAQNIETNTNTLSKSESTQKQGLSRASTTNNGSLEMERAVNITDSMPETIIRHKRQILFDSDCMCVCVQCYMHGEHLSMRPCMTGCGKGVIISCPTVEALGECNQ